MILVTGGAGFIGANFILDWMRNCAEPIVNLDKLTASSNRQTLTYLPDSSQHIFVQGDISDRFLVSSLLKQYQVKTVIHFAAESHVDSSIADASDFIETNITGTFHLLESVCKYYLTLTKEEQKTFRFLHVSTDEVYGSLCVNDPAFTEQHAYAPNNPYSATKAASDHLVRAWGHTFDLPVMITHCSNNFGPFQYPEKLIPLTVANALKGLFLPVYGTGEQLRDWLYVTEHAQAIQRVLEKGRVGEVYNIGGENERSNIDIVKMICNILDRMQPRPDQKSYQEQICFVSDRAGHDFRYAIDIHKISRELGWRPSGDFEKQMDETVRWYIEHPDWLEAVNQH